jgi:hypothetical protein
LHINIAKLDIHRDDATPFSGPFADHGRDSAVEKCYQIQRALKSQ